MNYGDYGCSQFVDMSIGLWLSLLVHLQIDKLTD